MSDSVEEFCKATESTLKIIGVDLLIIPSNDEFVIGTACIGDNDKRYINISSPENMIRGIQWLFTLFHEIGHHALGHLFDMGQDDLEVEIEAEEYALYKILQAFPEHYEYCKINSDAYIEEFAQQR